MLQSWRRLPAADPCGRLGPMIMKVVSGGQTGVDRAALDAALAAGLPVGGWCPKGRRAEDGVIDARYPLTETRTADYAERTRANVRDSDGTLVLTGVLTRGAPVGGTALTIAFARKMGRPLLVLDLNDAAPQDALAWIAAGRIATLNVAGPRESGAPGIYGQARAFLDALLAADRKAQK
jgi:hypothetical protein